MSEIGCLKDGHFQNLEVEGINIFNGNNNFKGKLTLLSASNINRRAITSDRYYLDEYFVQLPMVLPSSGLFQDFPIPADAAAAISAAHAASVQAIILKVISANKNFMALGTIGRNKISAGAPDAGQLDPSGDPGILISTTAATNNFSLVRPINAASYVPGSTSDAEIAKREAIYNHSAWNNIKWGIDNSTEWECSIKSPASIGDLTIWAGLLPPKASGAEKSSLFTSNFDGDYSYAFFRYQSNNPGTGNQTVHASNNKDDFNQPSFLHFECGDRDKVYISQIKLSGDSSIFNVNRIYHLKIKIDNARKVSMFVNGIQYNVTALPHTTKEADDSVVLASGKHGVEVTEGTTPSVALQTNTVFQPNIGVMNKASSVKTLQVHYICMNRII